MRISFFEDGQKQSFEIAKDDYIQICKKVSSGEMIDVASYGYPPKVIEVIAAQKPSTKKTQSDIDYEACEYDAQL